MVFFLLRRAIIHCRDKKIPHVVAFQHAVNVISITLCESICVKENNYDPFSVSESACPYLIRKEGRDSLRKSWADKGYSCPLANPRLLSK